MENDDAVMAIDTLANKVIATIPIGQAPQALNYVPDAAPDGRAQNLQPLGIAGETSHLTLGPIGQPRIDATSVALFDQGLVQILEAAVTGLTPRTRYVLGLVPKPDGSGAVIPLAGFMTNAAGAAVVNATGPIRSLVRGAPTSERRYLVVVPDNPGETNSPVQVQLR
jgi:YVTN family beta-propeller protein